MRCYHCGCNLTEHEKSIFIESFNDFINYYKMEVKDE